MLVKKKIKTNKNINPKHPSYLIIVYPAWGEIKGFYFSDYGDTRKEMTNEGFSS